MSNWKELYPNLAVKGCAMYAQPVDYAALKDAAYYDVINVDCRLREMLENTFESKIKAAQALKINNVRLSQERILTKNLLTLSRYVQLADTNLFYVLCGLENYKWESYINIRLSVGNILRIYEENLFKYQMPRTISVMIHRLRKNTLPSLDMLFILSRLYNKPVWWLIQDDKEGYVNPEIRKRSIEL